MSEIDSVIQTVAAGNDLNGDDVKIAVCALVDEAVSDETKADFLTALRRKGETAAEIAAFVKALIRRAIDPEISLQKLNGPMLDVCGTGGDRMNLFNVSTTAMFLLAAGGAVLVKHGNRGITSQCGGADVLEALGVNIALPPAAVRQCVEENGIGFLFAPNFHPAFKAIAPVRKKLAEQGLTTIFNLLGPLLNPARPPHQLIGVFSQTWLQKFAETALLLGRAHTWVVHGTSETGLGVDEISTMGETEICAVDERGLRFETITPEHFGFARADVEELRGGNCESNSRILTGILRGEIKGAKRDLVLLNAGAGFVVCNLAPDIHVGIELARAQIENGAAMRKLEALRSFGG